MRPARTVAAAGLSVVTLLVTACGGVTDPLAGASDAPSGSASAGAGMVVGSTTSTDSRILGELYAQALVAQGIPSTIRPGPDSREADAEALLDRSIAVVPRYTGNLLLSFDPNASATTAAEIEAALPAALPPGLSVLSSSPAADQDVYVVTRAFSRQNGVASLADLKQLPGTVVVGGPSALASRSYGPPGLDKIYGAKVRQFKPYDSPAVQTKDLLDGRIQLATYSTTASAIADNGLVQLADPQAMILPQNVVPLVSTDVSGNRTAVAALEAVQAALTTADLTALDRRVDSGRQQPDQVAAEWLKAKGLA